MTGHYGYYLPPYLNDRRSRKERRKFLYTVHIPERRTGKERRVGLERRKTPRGIRTIHGINRKSTVKNVF
jgi:hypothetical protein